MCQRTKRYIQKRIVKLRDEAAAQGAPTDRLAIERIIEELQAVLSTIEGAGDSSVFVSPAEDLAKFAEGE